MPAKRPKAKKKVSWQKRWAKVYKKHNAKLGLVLFVLVFVCLIVAGLHYKANWHLILDYTNSLKWPVLVLIVLYFERKEIPKIIENFFNKDSAKLTLPGGVSASYTNTSQPEPNASQVIDSSQVEQHATEVQAASSTTPDTLSIHAEDAVQTEDKASTAVINDELTVAKIQLEFERIYRNIFGTQLEALVRLKERQGGMSIERLGYLFQEYQKRTISIGAPPIYANAFQWLGWLEQYGLIQQDQGVYKITQAGEIFLTYLANQGIVANINAKGL